MTRTRRLPLLVAVLLLAQWGSAFAHCLRHVEGPAAAEIQICTAEGLVTLALPDGPDSAPPAIEGVACPLCQGTSSALLPTPTASSLPNLLLVQQADPPSPAPAPSPRRCSPPPPRAPPTS